MFVSSRVVMGPKLKVKTVAGDILLMDECFSEVILAVIKVRTIDLDLINGTILGFRIVHWHGSCSCEETFWQGNLSHQGRGGISSPHIESHLWNILFLAPLNFSSEISSVCQFLFRETCSMFLGMAVWMQWSKKEMRSSGKIWKDNSLGNFGKDF